MSGAQRRKGREGEHESRAIFEAVGCDVRPLQAGRNGRDDAGDYLVGCGGFVAVVESKRREKVRVVEWARTVEALALPGEVPVTVWRQSREPWRVTLLAEDFARLVALREAKQP